MAYNVPVVFKYTDNKTQASDHKLGSCILAPPQIASLSPTTFLFHYTLAILLYAKKPNLLFSESSYQLFILPENSYPTIMHRQLLVIEALAQKSPPTTDPPQAPPSSLSAVTSLTICIPPLERELSEERGPDRSSPRIPEPTINSACHPTITQQIFVE